jgi:hypothetical protein
MHSKHAFNKQTPGSGRGTVICKEVPGDEGKGMACELQPFPVVVEMF